MRLIGFMTFRDEEDILWESIPDFCRKLDVLVAVDCGSEDRSQEFAAGLEADHPNLIVLPSIGPHHARQVRRHFWYSIRRVLSPADWMIIADADEFIHNDPRAACEKALRQGADTVFGVHANFYYTESDHEEWQRSGEPRSSPGKPIAEQRLHYRMQTSQRRAFRNLPGLRWNRDTSFPDNLEIPSDETIIFRHYQYRDPHQIARRQEIRSRFDPESAVMRENPHWRSASFEDKISRNDPLMRTWDGVSELVPDPTLPRFNVYPSLPKRMAKRFRRIMRAAATRQEPCTLFDGAGLPERLSRVLERSAH